MTLQDEISEGAKQFYNKVFGSIPHTKKKKEHHLRISSTASFKAGAVWAISRFSDKPNTFNDALNEMNDQIHESHHDP